MRSIILITYLLLTINSIAQVKNRYTIIAIEAAPYRGGILGLDIRYGLPSNHVFLLKLNPFNYNTTSYSIKSSLVSPTMYSGVSGNTLKLGYGYKTTQRQKSFYTYWTISGVATRANYHLGIEYNDVLGKITSVYNESLVNYGAELDYNISCMLGKKLFLSTRFTLGYKQKRIALFHSQVDDFDAYIEYTPSQGKSEYNLYLNAGVSLGVFI